MPGAAGGDDGGGGGRESIEARADAANPDPERRTVMPCRDPECAPE